MSEVRAAHGAISPLDPDIFGLSERLPVLKR